MSESTSSEDQDSRSDTDKLIDFTDAKLTDYYHESGLLGAEEGKTYTYEDVLAFARGAYWLGVHDYNANPREMAKAALLSKSNQHS